MARILKDSYIILLVSMLVGLLCWLSEQVIATNVRLTAIEHKLDRLTDEMLIIKDGHNKRRAE